MEGCSLVVERLSGLFPNPLLPGAQGPEVFARPGRHVVEELENEPADRYAAYGDVEEAS